MQMLYNSDSFVVVQFDLGAAEGGASGAGGEGSPRGGFEIVDKFARKGIFLEGAAASSFSNGVQALIQQGPSEEALDEYISGFVTLAQQPVILH